MLKRCFLISVLFSMLVLIGCTGRFQSPQLEFVSLRHAHQQDTILFGERTLLYCILRFTSDKELDKCGYDATNLLLYASAQKRDFNYGDVIKNSGIREGEVFSGVLIKKICRKNDKYYYDAAVRTYLNKEELRYVNDTIYSKIFYVRMFLSIPQTEEMKIPKDSLNILFE